MGNELSSNTKNINNTELGKYVKEFMIDRYEHKPGDNNNFKNLLKKRACCRNTIEVPISLPSYDSKSGKLYPTVINIKVFDKESEITASACTFENNDEFRLTNPELGRNYVSGETCSNFYKTFCDSVYDGRRDYTDLYAKSYGKQEYLNELGLDKTLIDLHVGNQYIDCGCLNSIYVKHPKLFNYGGDTLSSTQMAQNKDKFCLDKSPNTTFIENNSKLQSLNICVNAVTLDKSSIAGFVGVSQNCSANTIGKQPPPPPLPPKTDSNPPPKTDSNPPPKPPSNPDSNPPSKLSSFLTFIMSNKKILGGISVGIFILVIILIFVFDDTLENNDTLENYDN